MIISFIGMSGIGKSHWSKKLKEKGFTVFCCDDLIEEKLGDELTLHGFSGIQDVAKWMGHPYEPQYKSASKKYLHFEKEVLEEVLERIKSIPNKDVIIDTTGSVIYTGKERLDRLVKISKIIYFEAPDSVKENMFKLYLGDPKPLIWGNQFHLIEGESQTDALVRCYPELLNYRSKKYEKIAHKKLDYHMLRDKNFSTDQFLQTIL